MSLLFSNLVQNAVGDEYATAKKMASMIGYGNINYDVPTHARNAQKDGFHIDFKLFFIEFILNNNNMCALSLHMHGADEQAIPPIWYIFSAKAFFCITALILLNNNWLWYNNKL